MPNFREIGDKKPEDIQKPILAPPGTFLFRITKPAEIRDVKSQATGQEWEAVEYSVKAVAPTEDVDTEALSAFGSVDKILNRVSFMFDKHDEVAFIQTENQHKRFLQDHVKCWPNDMTMKEAMAAAVNGQFLGTIVWKQDKNDPETFHANIGKTAPAS